MLLLSILAYLWTGQRDGSCISKYQPASGKHQQHSKSRCSEWTGAVPSASTTVNAHKHRQRVKALTQRAANITLRSTTACSNKQQSSTAMVTVPTPDSKLLSACCKPLQTAATPVQSPPRRKRRCGAARDLHGLVSMGEAPHLPLPLELPLEMMQQPFAAWI